MTLTRTQTLIQNPTLALTPTLSLSIILSFNLNLVLNILFQTMTERVTSHDLRRLYGYLAFRTYADIALIQESEYLAEILGQYVKYSFATLPYSIVEVI
jgi:hypothetical protein